MQYTRWPLRNQVLGLLFGLLLVCSGTQASDNPRVLSTTTLGEIEIELLENLAPLHVERFLSLVDDAFYDGLIFHRVIPGFVIQAGGYTKDLEYRPFERGVANESFNGVSNARFSVAMARLDDPDSGNTQFFINVNDNDFLDAKRNKPGYTVFGRVIAGKDVVEAIELVDTHLRMGMAGVPEEPIEILSTIKQ